MFKTRLLSGIMLMIIALTTVIAGGQVLFTVLFAISLIGMSELYKVFGIEKKCAGNLSVIFLLSGIMRLFIWKNISPGQKNIHGFMLLFQAYLICQMAVLVFSIRNIYTADHGGIFRSILCSGNAVLHLPYKNASGRSVYRMACVYLFVGMRYMCILCRHAHRKA